MPRLLRKKQGGEHGMKRIGVVLLLGVLLLSAAGLARRKEYRIFLITMDQMDQHRVTMDVGARKAVEELGNVIYQWMAPDVKDDAKQIRDDQQRCSRCWCRCHSACGQWAHSCCKSPAGSRCCRRENYLWTPSGLSGRTKPWPQTTKQQAGSLVRP